MASQSKLEVELGPQYAVGHHEDRAAFVVRRVQEKTVGYGRAHNLPIQQVASEILQDGDWATVPYPIPDPVKASAEARHNFLRDLIQLVYPGTTDAVYLPALLETIKEKLNA